MAEIDAIALVEKDHALIRKMFTELVAEQDTDARRALFEDIGTLVVAHSLMEVRVLYPAVRDAIGGPEAEVLFVRSKLEHELVERVIEQARGQDPSSIEFIAMFEVLRENLEHHMNLEEQVLLPRAREVLSSEQLAKLSDLMDQVKEEFLDRVAQKLVKEIVETMPPGA